MSVRAKFRVENVTEKASGGFIVQLVPVIGGSKENEEFYSYTPGGQIYLETVSAEAVGQFEINKEYYVDFIPSDMPQPEIGNVDTEAEVHAEQEVQAEEARLADTVASAEPEQQTNQEDTPNVTNN